MEIIAILCIIYDRHPHTLAEKSSRIEIFSTHAHNSLKPKTTDALSRFPGIWKFAKVICGTCGWALNKCQLWVPQRGAWNAINYNEKLQAPKGNKQKKRTTTNVCKLRVFPVCLCVCTQICKMNENDRAHKQKYTWKKYITNFWTGNFIA